VRAVTADRITDSGLDISVDPDLDSSIHLGIDNGYKYYKMKRLLKLMATDKRDEEGKKQRGKKLPLSLAAISRSTRRLMFNLAQSLTRISALMSMRESTTTPM
jgi:hypothetical protein